MDEKYASGEGSPLKTSKSEDGGNELATAVDAEDDTTLLKAFTLNCWGLKLISKFRKERFKAIGDFLLESDYDVVFLQEVWLDKDFESLVSVVGSKFPFSHYFDNGIIGSGTCIFSKTRLEDGNYHEFSMNGYPTNIWHGDWFASKGLGVCQTIVKGFYVHLYTSHYHANYNPSKDVYIGHRIIHAFESAQWIKLTASACDLTLYAGDFNSTHQELPYRLLRSIAPLKDCWEEFTGSQDGGETVEVRGNSFSSPTPRRDSPCARIDYVLYSAGPSIEAITSSCVLPLPTLVPGENFSYSDHQGVEAVIRLKRKQKENDPALYQRMRSVVMRNDRMEMVQESMIIMDKAIREVKKTQARFAVLALLMMLLFVATFGPSVMQDFTAVQRVTYEWLMFIPRFILSSIFMIFTLMATLFTKRELNALSAAKKQFRLLMSHDESH